MEYREVNGTSYHIETPQEVIDVLDACIENHHRIIIEYGDVKTGESWGETQGISGCVGRGCGDIKKPILLFNSKTIGGCDIMDNWILSIRESNGKKVLYKLKKGYINS